MMDLVKLMKWLPAVAKLAREIMADIPALREALKRVIEDVERDLDVNLPIGEAGPGEAHHDHPA